MRIVLLCCWCLYTCSLLSCAKNTVIEKLDRIITGRKTHVCLPLAVDFKSIPSCDFDARYPVEANMYMILQKLIDESAEHVCAYMLDKTYFDQYMHSQTLLTDLINYIRSRYPDIPLFMNGLCTPTANSANVLKSYFDRYTVDGIVVSPYEGDEVFQALARFKDKVGIVRVKTGTLVEDSLLVSQIPVWQFILDLVIFRWNNNNNLIPSLCLGLDEVDVHQLRTRIPASMHCMITDEDYEISAYNMANLQGALGSETFACPVSPTIYSYASARDAFPTHVIKKLIQLKQLFNQCKHDK